jgi:hypothetical protein
MFMYITMVLKILSLGLLVKVDPVSKDRLFYFLFVLIFIVDVHVDDVDDVDVRMCGMVFRCSF